MILNGIWRFKIKNINILVILFKNEYQFKNKIFEFYDINYNKENT